MPVSILKALTDILLSIVLAACGGALAGILLSIVLAGCGSGSPSGGGGGPAGPRVTVTNPMNTANGAGLRRDIVAVFSQEPDAATVNVDSFTLTGPSGPVNGTVGLLDVAAHFTPAGPLAFDTDYNARLTTAIKDKAGNHLAADYVWRFNTGKKIVAGFGHTCARFDDGRVKCWGANPFGELGLGDSTPRGELPQDMGNDLPAVNMGSGRSAVQLAAGDAHTCARLDNGQVKCWGLNALGELGLGDNSGDRHEVGDQTGEMGNALSTLDLGLGRTALQLVAGSDHTCARLDNGQLKCWGNNHSGQLGVGDIINRGDQGGTDPQAAAYQMGDKLPGVELGSGRTAMQVVAGRSFTCALLDNAQVKCWGYNGDGISGLGDTNGKNLQIGDQAGEMGDKLPAVDLGLGRTAVQLAAGERHVCALLDNGPVKCWGANERGQLGLGDNTGAVGDQPNEMGDNLPAVDFGTAFLGHRWTVMELAAGGSHTCARLVEVATQVSVLKCWGDNRSGELGLGDVNERGDQPNEMGNNLPAVELGAGRAAVQISAGFSHTCALLDSRQIKCWGDNNAGQLGLGDVNDRGDQPNEMGDLLPVVVLGP